MDLYEYNIVDALECIIDYRGRTPKKSNEGIPTLSAKSVKMGYIDYDQCYFISKEEYDSFMVRGFPQKGDILFTTEAPLGLVAKLDRNDVAVAQRLLTLRGKKGILDNDYLLYYLQSYEGQQRIMAKQSGSTVMGIRQEEFRKINIQIPSYTNQKKIAAVLSALDDKIALNKKMNQKLEAMAKRLYDYWFVQFDFPDENGRPYKTSGGKMEYNPTLKREIPEGWKVTRLGDLFKTNRGVSYSTPTLGTEGDGVPMINLASFSPNESYNEKGIKYYKGEYTDEKVLKPFDFVMCNTQQTAIDPQKDIIGRSMLVPDIFDGDIVSSHHVNTIKLEKENLKFYLNRLFNTKFYHAYISKFANGTNILGLIFSGVEDYMCEIPSDDLLEKFAKISLDIEKKKSKIIKENQKLTALRDKLLPLLMNGQVMVG